MSEVQLQFHWCAGHSPTRHIQTPGYGKGKDNALGIVQWRLGKASNGRVHVPKTRVISPPRLNLRNGVVPLLPLLPAMPLFAFGPECRWV